MKNLGMALILWCTTVGANAQAVNKIIFDEAAQQDILYGYCTPQAFSDPMFESWYNFEYNSYEPQKGVVEKLDPLMNGVSIRVVLATWCSDSQREVPRFLKILSQLNINERATVELICVNRAKTAIEIGIGSEYVDFVPTFIFSKNGKEVGRIIETPSTSLEEDMLNMLK